MFRILMPLMLLAPSISFASTSIEATGGVNCVASSSCAGDCRELAAQAADKKAVQLCGGRATRSGEYQYQCRAIVPRYVSVMYVTSQYLCE